MCSLCRVAPYGPFLEFFTAVYLKACINIKRGRNIIHNINTIIGNNIVKICYLIPGCGVSGGIAVVCQHANRLARRGYNVLLVVDGYVDDMSWFPDQRVEVVSIDNYPDNVDVLVATAWSTSFKVAELSARRKFYFVQSDETRFHPSGSIWQHFTALSYCFDFEYLTEARWIQSWLRDDFGHEVHLVPNGLDCAVFYPCQPLAPKGKRLRVLLEGAIALPYKGMADAFAAIAPLDVEVWCVSSLGDPDPDWKCHRFFKQIPMDRMNTIYSSCDILLKLSRVEGFFGPPLEMMACGGVAVVAKVTGYDEYIVDGFNALVVEPGDIIGARMAIQRLIDDPVTLQFLRDNGRITASQWNWSASIDILDGIFGNTNHCQILKKSYTVNINDSIVSLYHHNISDNRSEFIVGSNDTYCADVERFCQWLKKQNMFKYFAKFALFCYYYIKKMRSWYIRKNL